MTTMNVENNDNEIELVCTVSLCNTSDLYIHYMDKSIGTRPFFRTEIGTSKTVASQMET